MVKFSIYSNRRVFVMRCKFSGCGQRRSDQTARKRSLIICKKVNFLTLRLILFYYVWLMNTSSISSRKHVYVILTHSNPIYIFLQG